MIIIAVVALQDTEVYMIIIVLFILFRCLDRLLIEVKDLAILALEKVLLILAITVKVKGYDWVCKEAVITVKSASRLWIIPVRNDALESFSVLCM